MKIFIIEIDNLLQKIQTKKSILELIYSGGVG